MPAPEQGRPDDFAKNLREAVVAFGARYDAYFERENANAGNTKSKLDAAPRVYALREDLLGRPIRVTTVDAGLVETEFSIVRFRGDQDRAKNVYKGFRPLTAEDIADTISYIVNLPPHVNILDLIIVPTQQRNIYVVDRKPE